MADHQEALGQRAFECIDDLNRNTVTKFNDISSFRDSISQRKTQEAFYKANSRSNTLTNSLTS